MVCNYSEISAISDTVRLYYTWSKYSLSEWDYLYLLYLIYKDSKMK